MLSLSNDDLRTVLTYHARVETRAAAQLKPYIDTDPDSVPTWRRDVEKILLQGKVGKYFLIAHPIVLLSVLDLPILKKDRQEIYRLQREELALHNLANDFIPVIRKEILAWDST
jgi:hypothetical protein